MQSAATAGFRGQVYITQESPTDATVWKELGEARDGTLTVNQNEIEVTSFDSDGWMENIPGLKGWEMSIEALYVKDRKVGQQAVWNALVGSQVIWWRFVPNRQAKTYGYEGQGFASSFEVGVPVDDAVTLALTIVGSYTLVPYQIT